MPPSELDAAPLDQSGMDKFKQNVPDHLEGIAQAEIDRLNAKIKADEAASVYLTPDQVKDEASKQIDAEVAKTELTEAEAGKIPQGVQLSRFKQAAIWSAVVGGLSLLGYCAK